MCSQSHVTTFTQKRGVTKYVKKGDLALYFDQPIEKVAAVFGVSVTIIKRLCRKHGINRWPYRKVRFGFVLLFLHSSTLLILSFDSCDFKYMLNNLFTVC